MLQKRLIFGCLLAASVIGLTWLDGYLSAIPVRRLGVPLLGVDIMNWVQNGLLITVLLLSLTILAAEELRGLAEMAGCKPFGAISTLFAAGFVVGPYITFNLRSLNINWIDESYAMLWMSIAMGMAFWFQATRVGVEKTFINLSSTLFILFYSGGLAGYLTRLRMEVGGPSGAALTVFSMFVVKMTDTGAFFTGYLLGRHKMIPWLSPGKTWEGLIGGVAAALISSAVCGTLLHRYGLMGQPSGHGADLGVLLLFGLIMAGFSVAGDLCASLLKRDAAIKASGSIFPGLGGVLEVLDSPLLAAPAAWFFWTRLIQVMG